MGGSHGIGDASKIPEMTVETGCSGERNDGSQRAGCSTSFPARPPTLRLDAADGYRSEQPEGGEDAVRRRRCGIDVESEAANNQTIFDAGGSCRPSRSSAQRTDLINRR